MLFFEVTDAEILSRLDRRRSVEHRADDDPAAVATRLKAYREQTAPVTDYYRSQGLLNIVDGLQPIHAVTEQLAAALAALPSHQNRSDVR